MTFPFPDLLEDMRNLIVEDFVDLSTKLSLSLTCKLYLGLLKSYYDGNSVCGFTVACCADGNLKLLEWADKEHSFPISDKCAILAAKGAHRDILSYLWSHPHKDEFVSLPADKPSFRITRNSPTFAAAARKDLDLLR